MVFMEDSARGAQIALDAGIDVGLHINLTESFTGSNVPARLARDHDRLRRFLRRSKYALLLYNPFLADVFASVVKGQIEEFSRLFGRNPSHFDGHQHMHLGTNMVMQGLIPAGTKVRRSFSFLAGEKSSLNRAYRAWIDARLERRHVVTRYFFALSQNMPAPRLDGLIDLARTSAVELMTHPEINGEFEYLMSEPFGLAIERAQIGDYSALQ